MYGCEALVVRSQANTIVKTKLIALPNHEVNSATLTTTVHLGNTLSLVTSWCLGGAVCYTIASQTTGQRRAGDVP